MTERSNGRGPRAWLVPVTVRGLRPLPTADRIVRCPPRAERQAPSITLRAPSIRAATGSTRRADHRARLVTRCNGRLGALLPHEHRGPRRRGFRAARAGALHVCRRARSWRGRRERRRDPRALPRRSPGRAARLAACRHGTPFARWNTHRRDERGTVSPSGSSPAEAARRAVELVRLPKLDAGRLNEGHEIAHRRERREAVAALVPTGAACLLATGLQPKAARGRAAGSRRSPRGVRRARRPGRHRTPCSERLCGVRLV